MSSKISTIGVLVFFFVMTMIVAMFGLSYYREQSTVHLVQESMKVSAYSNVDNSSRVERKLFRLDKQSFEKDLKKYIEENNDIEVEEQSINVNYETEMINGFEGIKKITVNFTEDGTEHIATLVVDKADD